MTKELKQALLHLLRNGNTPSGWDQKNELMLRRILDAISNESNYDDMTELLDDIGDTIETLEMGVVS